MKIALVIGGFILLISGLIIIFQSVWDSSIPQSDINVWAGILSLGAFLSVSGIMAIYYGDKNKK